MANFPDQVDDLVFNLDQVRALASPALGQVFWALTAREPLSAREVGEHLGKSAQSVHHHLLHLLEVGLVLTVGERKRHARTEKLYVRAGVTCQDMGPGGGEEYQKYRIKAFSGAMRVLVRERELMVQLAKVKPDVWDHEFYQRIYARLNEDQVAALKRKLNEIRNDLFAIQQNPDSPRVEIVNIMHPTVGQSREWMRELGMKPSRDESDDDE